MREGLGERTREGTGWQETGGLGDGIGREQSGWETTTTTSSSSRGRKIDRNDESRLSGSLLEAENDGEESRNDPKYNVSYNCADPLVLSDNPTVNLQRTLVPMYQLQ